MQEETSDMTKTCLCVLLVLFCAVPACGDTIQTKSGETIKGRVVEETGDHVRVETRYGELTVPRADIRRHVRTTYVVELKDGSKLEGQIVGENQKELTLKVRGAVRTVPAAQVRKVSEKKATPPPKKPRKLSPRQVQALHRRAMAYFNKKEYKKCIAEYRKILRSDPEHMIALYNTACAYSLLKDKDHAVEYLKKSVEAGYVNFAHMEKDKDIDNIRDEEGYKEIFRKKAEYIRKSTDKAVARITRSLAQRGVDAKRYKTAFDRERNFVYLHTKSAEQFAVIRKGLEEYAEYQWQHLFQNRPTRPLYIVLLTAADSRKVFRRRAGGVFSAGSNTLLCGDIPGLKLMKTSVIVHEFTHALHFADMLARHQRHPIWLLEGLATLFEASDRNGGVVPRHSYRLAIVQAAVRSGRTLPWKTLMKMNHAAFMRTSRLAYAQSRYMLFYMYEKGLLKKFYDEYTDKANYASDTSALESFEVVFGKPIESVEREWKQWVLKQRVPPIPYLGVRTRQAPGGVVVTLVSGGSPAAKAGLKKGDTIAAISGRAIKTVSDLMEAVGHRKVCDEVEVEIVRQGASHTLKARLGRRPGSLPRPARAAPYLGLTVEQKDGTVRAKEVAKGSPAERAGITPGTIILALNGKRVDSVRTYLSALKSARAGQKLKVKIKREGKVWEVFVKLAAYPAG